MKKLIGIIGTKGSGKTTVGEIFRDSLGDTLMTGFADPIKEMVGFGFTVDPDAKELPILPDVDITIGRVLQLLGTEFGRDLIHPDVWIKIAAKKYEQMTDDTTMILHDVRFGNEAAWITANGGILVKVMGREGREDGRDVTHQSEVEQINLKQDITMFNNYPTIADLRRYTREMIIPYIYEWNEKQEKKAS